MTADPILAFGEIATSLDKSELASALGAEGIDSEAAPNVVRCRIGDDLVEWQPTKKGFMLTGARDWSPTTCQRLSLALGARQVRHRIELYADDETLVGYLHHGWPQKDA